MRLSVFRKKWQQWPKILSKQHTMKMSNFLISSFTQFFFSNVILTTITRYIDFISFCIISRLAAQNQNNFPYFGCFLDHATLVLSTSSLDFEKIRKTFLKSAEDISTVRLFF